MNMVWYLERNLQSYEFGSYLHLSVERREWVTSDKRVCKAGEKSRRKTGGAEEKCPEEEESTKERQEAGGKNPAGGCCHGV